MFCAPTLEITSPRISIVPCSFGLFDLVPDSCSKTIVLETTTSSKLPDEFLGNFGDFSDEMFYGQSAWSKVKKTLNTSLTTEKNMFLYCRLRKSCRFTED